MRLVDRINERTISRADPVSLEEFGYLLGQTGGVGKSKAGVTVGVNRALGIPAWYSGVYYLSTSVAFLPWAAYRKSGNSRTQRAVPLWMDRPDVEMPWPMLLEFWMMSLLHRGNAFAFKIRDSANMVVGLRALHPDRVKVGQATDGTKVFQLDNRQDMGFTSREVLHIPGLSYDGIVGLDPIRVHAETLGTIAAADEYASRSFGQGSHLQAYISVEQTLTGEQADALKFEWEKFHKGVQNANSFGVLGNGAEYKTISLDPEQTQLLETRKYGTVQVAQLLRLPPHKLYDLERATFSNIEHQAIESTTDGVKPWVERIETWISFDLDLMPQGNYLEADLDGLLRGDVKTRYEAKKVAVDAGAYSPAQWREDENWPAVPGLDYYLRPLNMDTIGPDADHSVDEDTSSRAIAEAVQKIYLGVDTVMRADEARQILNRLGAGLTGTLPKEIPNV